MPENCPHCGQKVKIGQSRLTDAEIESLPIGNQNTDDRPTLIQWQVVKAAAEHYGVRDWVSKVDTSLTYEENVELMRKNGTGTSTAGGKTVRELAAREQAKKRWRQNG